MKFKVHDIDSAPEPSRPVMEGAKKKYGFVPNLIGVFATSPAAAEAYTAIEKALEKAALDPVEQQLVMLTVSAENDCEYCVAAHSKIAQGADMPEDVLEALREESEIPDRKLQALASFTRSLMKNRGWIPDDDLEAFADAGYSERHVLDVIAILAMKTLSNYTNHIAETPLDDAFSNQEWHPKKDAA